MMSRQWKSGKVYYHVLKGDRFVFADERNKKRLLDIVAELQQKHQLMIYAFCLTDDSAYFILEAAGRYSLEHMTREAAVRFRRQCRYGRPPGWSGGRGLPRYSASELGSLREIVVRSREIHRIPLEQGYVRCIGDYWWSSYISYTGSYDWDLVDCRILLLYFSADREVARQRLERYHCQSGSSAALPA